MKAKSINKQTKHYQSPYDNNKNDHIRYDSDKCEVIEEAEH